MSKICCIDGDILLYRIGYSKHSDQYSVLYDLYSLLVEILSINESDSYVGFLSDKTNFRYKVATTRPYKGNRENRELPPWYDFVKAELIKLGFVIVNNIEADDALSITARLVDGVTCSIDKDLLQIPGYHYNIVKKEFIFVDPRDARFHLWTQVISGDTIDNIVGVKGIGKKGAVKFLQIINAYDHYNYPEAVLALYMKHYGEEDGICKFYENYRLIKLLEDDIPCIDHNQDLKTISESLSSLIKKFDYLKPIEYYIGKPKIEENK